MTTTEKKDQAGAADQVEKMTATEALDSLTGFDEIAIEQAFGADVTQLSRTSVGKFGRALGFVLARRDGMSDAEARKHILGLTRKQIDDLFADDVDDELPGASAGKADES